MEPKWGSVTPRLAVGWPTADRRISCQNASFWNCDRIEVGHLLASRTGVWSPPLVNRHLTAGLQACSFQVRFSVFLLHSLLHFTSFHSLSNPCTSRAYMLPKDNISNISHHHNSYIHHHISIFHQNHSNYKSRHRVPIQNRNVEFWRVINTKCM